MRHGVFSVTKSLGAAVALWRLAQKYGDEVLALKIKDYVPVTAAHDGWERVTFADALNMATGIGDNAPQRQPNAFFADANTPKMIRQWLSRRGQPRRNSPSVSPMANTHGGLGQSSAITARTPLSWPWPWTAC